MQEKDIKIVLPFLGEFGSLLGKHVPGVAGASRPLIISHEEGLEALYPDAIERHTFPRASATQRKAGGNVFQQAGSNVPEGFIPYHDQVRKHFEPQVWEDHIKTGKPLQWQRHYVGPVEPFRWSPKRYFIPQHQREYDCDFDVLLLARRQSYAHSRNFPHWIQFHEALQKRGIRCLVAGQPDSTQDLPCPAVWDLVDHPSQILDCTLWAMKKAKLRIATSTGTALLASLCGQNIIIIISETGCNVQGSKMSFPAGYFYKLDHQHVGYRIISHWVEWERTIEEFLWFYDDLDKFNSDCKLWVKKIIDNEAIPDPDAKWRNLK